MEAEVKLAAEVVELWEPIIIVTDYHGNADWCRTGLYRLTKEVALRECRGGGVPWSHPAVKVGDQYYLLNNPVYPR